MIDVGLTHVALCVSNLEASIDFYEKFAALSPVHRREGVVWLADGQRPFVIVLIEIDTEVSTLAASNHLGCAVATQAEVDTLAAEAEKLGILIDGPNDSGPPVGYWFYMRDPDGHTLEISCGQEVGTTATPPQSN